MQYLINSLTGKFSTSRYSSEIGKCLGVALENQFIGNSTYTILEYMNQAKVPQIKTEQNIHH